MSVAVTVHCYCDKLSYWVTPSSNTISDHLTIIYAVKYISEIYPIVQLRPFLEQMFLPELQVNFSMPTPVWLTLPLLRHTISKSANTNKTPLHKYTHEHTQYCSAQCIVSTYMYRNSNMHTLACVLCTHACTFAQGHKHTYTHSHTHTQAGSQSVCTQPHTSLFTLW